VNVVMIKNEGKLLK